MKRNLTGPMRSLLATGSRPGATNVLFVNLLLVTLMAGSVQAQVRLIEDFESGLSQWELTGPSGISTRHIGGEHGDVFVLTPDGDVYALIVGSEHWGGVRMEGEVLFPHDEHNYLGVIYNYRRRGLRTDFGSIYIKGNSSYLRVNPNHDMNVGRALYEEYRTELEGRTSIRIGEWQRFKLEVIGADAHFYVGNMETPQLTFSSLELNSGAIGLKPRSVGSEVWVDNLKVESIDSLAYPGPALPPVDYYAESLLTEWEVIGPLPRTDDIVARRPWESRDRWRSFQADHRGAVVTGRVVDFHGPNTVAYFRTRFTASESGDAVLHLSTVDDLALWVNGRFWWFIGRDRLAWYDFWSNPEHEGQRIPIALVEGENEIVLRVRGGAYASGGFFARIEH